MGRLQHPQRGEGRGEERQDQEVLRLSSTRRSRTCDKDNATLTRVSGEDHRLILAGGGEYEMCVTFSWREDSKQTVGFQENMTAPRQSSPKSRLGNLSGTVPTKHLPQPPPQSVECVKTLRFKLARPVP